MDKNIRENTKILEEVDKNQLLKEISEIAEKCGKVVVKILTTKETDKRWANIGITDLQKGFMELTRSVTKPALF